MESLVAECLRCGALHARGGSAHLVLEGCECPRCRYPGWAPSALLTEDLRRTLRDRPPEQRRVRLVA